MSNYLIGHLVLGPALLLIGLLFKFYPPKNINGFYGYRTPRSMKSQEAWKEGNRYGANVVLIIAILTCLVQVVTYSLVEGNLGFTIPAAFLALGLFSSLFIIEMHLKRKGF